MSRYVTPNTENSGQKKEEFSKRQVKPRADGTKWNTLLRSVRTKQKQKKKIRFTDFTRNKPNTFTVRI
ncbi:hypothetical protein CEXT_641541 [Caerostris extrusa]|uniref:Ribosomal protein S18 n=1 Tax=Caerostris extrusa TaxID=172846 RepID=A0AAV4VQK5_CAEEX|nr:hypothetical protein CEXT_641541 [Caerostris extrusa]